MNTMLKGLLVAAMALSAAHVQATTNHTYLAPRPVGVNLAMESVSFAEMTNAKDEGRFGGDLQATVFYSQSDNSKALGRYFGVNNKSSFSVFDETDAVPVPDVPMEMLIHLNAAPTSGLYVGTRTAVNTVSFAPKSEVYGLRFDYHQDLAKILDGLYFKVQLPIVKVKNDMRLNISGTNSADLIKFFNGSYSQVDGNENAQIALANAKIAGSNSDTGIADIDMALGYAFLNKERYRAALNIGLTIPTSAAPKGINVFEAVCGNGGHFALGAGLEGVARVWGDEHTNIKLNAALNYRYAFEATEKRSLGVLSAASHAPYIGEGNLGQYLPLVDTVGAHLIPAANIGTLDVNVTPGSMLDGIAGISYNRGGLTLDAGYNLNYKEKDSVSIKNAWNDAQYAVIDDSLDHSFATNYPFATAIGDGYEALTKSTLDTTHTKLNTDAARNESLSHKVYGQVGYIFKDMEYPVMLAAGGHYEFAGNNSSIQNWGLNLKAGLSF